MTNKENKIEIEFKKKLPYIHHFPHKTSIRVLTHFQDGNFALFKTQISDFRNKSKRNIKKNPN